MINLLISLSQLRVSTRSKKRDKKKRKVKKLTLDQSLYRGILLQPMGKENFGMGNEEKGTRFIRGNLSNADLFQAVMLPNIILLQVYSRSPLKFVWV